MALPSLANGIALTAAISPNFSATVEAPAKNSIRIRSSVVGSLPCSFIKLVVISLALDTAKAYKTLVWVTGPPAVKAIIYGMLSKPCLTNCRQSVVNTVHRPAGIPSSSRVRLAPN